MFCRLFIYSLFGLALRDAYLEF